MPAIVERFRAVSRLEWILLFVGWSLLALLQGLVTLSPGQGAGTALRSLVLLHLPLAWFWALATPAIGAWAIWVRDRVRNGAVRLLSHIPAVVIAALTLTMVRRLLLMAYGVTLQVPFSVTLLYYGDLTIVAYLIAVWTWYAFEGRRRLVEREARATGLEARLTEARLAYLETQVRPHFLFNALSTVSELAHRSPDAAAGMLANIRQLLRNAIAGHGMRGKVSLSREIEDLGPYLAIQRIRFADWLELIVDVPAAAVDALVPRLVLQPVVENAVHHGLMRRDRGGRITITATASGGRLRIRVIDSGQGSRRGDRGSSHGIGHRNVRERLHALYGADASLELLETAQGETEAVLDLPFETAERGAAAPEILEAPAREREPFLSGPLVRFARARPWTTLVMFWLVVGVLRLQYSLSYLAFRDRLDASSFAQALRSDVVVAAMWVVLTPIVIRMARRFPVRRRWLPATLALHGAMAALIALLHTVVVRLLSGQDQLPLASAGNSQIYALNVATYAVIVALVHIGLLEEWITERELAASRLRLALQEARLKQAMIDLRPAVLIDFLRHVEGVTRTDPARAERLLTHMGDFLRLTLDVIEEPVIPLRQECDRLAAYAKVLQGAGEPGLSLDIDPGAGMSGQPVPNGILRTALDSALAGERNLSPGFDIRVERASGQTFVTVTPAAVVQPA